MRRNDLNNKADICVSIILPVFNREKTIESAILSVLEQTYTKFELIVVDDGSSDNSVSLAQQMASQDDRIKVITHPKNSGRGRSRLVATGRDPFYPKAWSKQFGGRMGPGTAPKVSATVFNPCV